MVDDVIEYEDLRCKHVAGGPLTRSQPVLRLARSLSDPAALSLCG